MEPITDTGSDWERGEDLLMAALQVAPAERRGLIAKKCPNDDALRRRVLDLLAQDEELLEQLDQPVVDLLRFPSEIGHRLGPYQLLEELGHGGGGVVYLGRRDDGEFDRQVAVKILRRGLDSVESVNRFRNERQILADLRHPNIAELYEGGTTSDGRPYLVMEWVDGEPIDRYADRLNLGIEARIALFLKVCAAVERAHQRLVVHRDLKPSNILVDGLGEPKLLDFGIAKLLDASDTSTPAGDFQPRTPGYASPEQIRGEGITTATDVYSLGVLLYELLTGRRPHRGDSDAVEKAVCRRRPPLPSVVTLGRNGTAHASPRRLRGDLDAILLKALHRAPEGRYRSVEGLAHDLRNHLANLPVASRPDSVFYRGGKFLRRHLRPLTLLLLVLGAFGVFRWHAHDRLERERDRAQRISTFLMETFEPSSPEGVRFDTSARDLLDRGAEKMATLPQDDFELRIGLGQTLARGYSSLGYFEPASELLRQALALRRQVSTDPDGELLELLTDLASSEGAAGRYEDAEERFQEALELATDLHGTDSLESLRLTSALALMAMDRGHHQRAEALLRVALAGARARLGEYSHFAAAATGNLAILRFYRGDLEESERLYRRALELSIEVLGEGHPQVLANRSNLATLLRHRGELEEAERLYRRVLVRYRANLGKEHPAISAVLHHLAVIHRQTGRLDEAERLIAEALRQRRTFFEEGHDWIAKSRVEQAWQYRLRGDAKACEREARSALASLERKFEPGHRTVASSRVALGACLLDQGRLDEAEVLVRGGVAHLSRQRGTENMETREGLQVLAEIEAARRGHSL